MNNSLKQYLEDLGAKAVDDDALKDYRREMEERVVPGIVQAVKERQRLAAESRLAPVQRPPTPAPEQDS
jgi:uncharacterized membrane protein